MDPVEIQASIVLSRVAIGDIPFGRVVEGAGPNKCGIFGGASKEDALNDCEAQMSAGAQGTVSLDTAEFGGTNNNKVVTTGTSGVLCYEDIALQTWTDEAVGILIKSSVAQAAGDLSFNIAKDAAIATPSDTIPLPAMAAGKWYYFSLAFLGALATREDLLSYGLVDETGVAADLHIEFIGLGSKTYGPAGFANDDQAKEGDVAEEFDDVKILAAGHILGFLAAGQTCIAEQPLFPVPGTGDLATTEIVFDGGNRPITATEVQATAGGRVGVRL